jgi:hypothetical protein
VESLDQFEDLLLKVEERSLAANDYPHTLKKHHRVQCSRHSPGNDTVVFGLGQLGFWGVHMASSDGERS